MHSPELQRLPDIGENDPDMRCESDWGRGAHLGFRRNLKTADRTAV